MKRALALLLLCWAGNLYGQQKVSDLTMLEGEAPVRLVGYGLVVGLDGSGDRAIGGFGSRQTVQSVANLLRNFDIEVPTEMLRTRNVAAVLVTAEASPYQRSGGRFDVQVASVGDAASLRGGTLWATPLLPATGGEPVALAQGTLLLSAPRTQRDPFSVETSARVPQGGVLSNDLPRPNFQSSTRLLLGTPDLATATRIADAINAAVAANTASVEDPGAIRLTLADTSNGRTAVLAKIEAVTVDAPARAEIVIDARDGTVVAGGDLTVGPAVVSHAGITLAVGPNAAAPAATANSALQLKSGASVRDVAAALQAIGTPARSIAAVFESLHTIGAIAARVRTQ